MKSHPELNELKYINKSASNLSEEEYRMCSKLFSGHYGVWDEKLEHARAGKRIELKPGYYKKLAQNKKMHVSLAYEQDKVIGQAYYMRKRLSSGQYASWIIQLVVHTDYRQRGIAGRLLSIHGDSGDTACGLATTNPYTVKALESATLRTCQPKIIKQNISLLKELAQEISFAKDAKLLVRDSSSLIDTAFEIDQSRVTEKIRNAYGERWLLGELKPGHEWLAFVFQGRRDLP